MNKKELVAFWKEKGKESMLWGISAKMIAETIENFPTDKAIKKLKYYRRKFINMSSSVYELQAIRQLRKITD